MNYTIRIALLGVSHWHLPLYLPGLPEGAVVGISDDNMKIAAALAKRYGCPAYTDEREMIAKQKPDFVFAFAPHDRMKAVAMFLLESGIPFSMEKPAGLNAAEVETLYETCEKRNGFCSIPFVWRYSDTVNDLKKIYLKSPIVHMSFRFIAGPPSRYRATSPWMLSKKTAGGGCMTNLGVHFIDMAMFLTDSCSADALASAYQYSHEYDIETYATSLLRLPTGASLLLESGYAFPMSETLKRENRWTVVTENGYYILAENSLEIREYGTVPAGVALNTDSDVYYAKYTKTTLNDWMTGVRPRASLKEMLDVSRVLDAINEKAGKPVVKRESL